MEEKDVAPSPDWNTARSATSRGLQRSGTSSSNLSGLRSVFADSLRSGWYSDDKPDIVEIFPHETEKCAQLTLTIQKSERLQSCLQTTVDTIQRHAKWFPPAGLEALLQHALSRASESKSTADVDVALDLIDSVITFAVLPQACLPSVVRFISFAYHTGKRMHKHKSLGVKAWDVYQHILHSHLGALSIVALLDLLDKEETQWSRSSFAAVSGALRLIEEKFIISGSTKASKDTVTVTALLLHLKNIVKNGDDMLKEQVVAILQKCITNDTTITDINALACWSLYVDLVESCGTISDDSIGQSFLDRLAGISAKLEPVQLSTLSTVFMRAGHELPKGVADQLLIPIQAIHRIHNNNNNSSVQKHDMLLKTFATTPQYAQQLKEVIRNDLDLLLLCEVQKDWIYLVGKYMEFISSEDITREAAVCCTVLISTLFHSAFETSFQRSRLWKVTLIFDTITKLAVSAPHVEARLCAFRALARLRVTIDGFVYIAEEDDSAYADEVLVGTAPGAVLISDLPRKLWLDEMISLIREPELEQHAMTASFVLKTLPAQLGNPLFFVDQRDFIRTIYDIAIHKLASTTNANSGNYIRMLTTLINYRGLFSPSEERQIVDLFIRKSGSSEMVSKDCIHALTLCCHEIPDTVARDLDYVIQKMAQMITQKHLAIHVLEFLTGLSRLPNLFRNFRSDDFKKIFGVSMSYLQSLRDGQMSRQSTANSSDTGSGSHQATHEILPQYVYALAHHVMIFWYIALRPDDRPPIKAYVTNGLCFRRDGDKDMPDDQGLVVIDFMERVDTESTAQTGPRKLAEGDMTEIFDELDSTILTQHRICGMVLISTHTSVKTAKTLVTTRRPSGTTKYLVFGRNSVTRESWTSTFVSAAPPSVWSGSAGDDETMTIYSDDTDGAAYGAITVPNSASPLGSVDIVTLPEEPALDRSIALFDRTPGLDSHKAGVVYIGEGQTNEEDILANSSGSPDYTDIVNNLGILQELRGAKFNTQGLDTRSNEDGKHVIVWNNEITELVFHVTTMMPTNITDKHASAIKKKAHIGNDHVNIVFNNSGMPFRFDTFPSQFDYVYIVITPSVRTTFLQTRTHTINTSSRNRFYTVEVMTRDGFPAISSAAEPKMISGASLPSYVRNLALNACVFSAVWQNRDSEEYKSSWRQRLNQIRRLKDRYAPEGSAAPVTRPNAPNKGKGKSHFWK